MLITTSVHTLAFDGALDEAVVETLSTLSEEFYVLVLSNRSKPIWFDEAFEGTDVEFFQIVRRRDGTALKEAAADVKLPAHKVMVLAGSQDDIAMARNAGAVLVGAGWAEDEYVAKTGLEVESPAEFEEVVQIVDGWSGDSWFRAEGDGYSIESVCDMSTYYQSAQQQRFGQAVKAAVKSGGAGLNGLLAVTSCVLLEEAARKKKLLWGVYPSSSSTNDDSDTLSDFGHRLRTSVSGVHFCKRDVPLFMRHRPTIKRSAGGAGDRTDPTSEIESVHLNPFYQSRLPGRNVIVLDDCITHGISMATAAGLLKAAYAKSVTCLSIGKFGNCLDYYDVHVKSSPFEAVTKGNWSTKRGSWNTIRAFDGAQTALRDLLLGE